MELLLHIGTNKTGSSFLQSTLAINKKDLLKKGIFIPDSPWDAQMEAGIISPGNGYRLAKCLAGEQPGRLKSYLESLVASAKERGLSQVLLSNEVLIRLFSNENTLGILCRQAKAAGFDSLRAICLLRNPYGHALSLYKHRAKRGKHADYSVWFSEDYETLRLFAPFLDFYKRYPVDWQFAYYRKDPSVLLELFFEKFLNLQPPKEHPIQRVNPSLSLNRIRLLQWYEHQFPGSHTYVYKALLEGGDVDSEENPYLLARFWKACRQTLDAHACTLENLAGLLPEPDRDAFRARPPEQELTTVAEIFLAAEDLKAVEMGMKKYKRERVYRFLKNTYRSGRRGWRSLFERSKTFDSRRYGGSLR